MNEIENLPIGTPVYRATRGGPQTVTFRGLSEDKTKACVEVATGRLLWVPAEKLSV
jgi:hypothetical protein